MHQPIASSAMPQASLLKHFSSGPKFDRLEGLLNSRVGNGGLDEAAPNLVGCLN